MLIFFLTGRPNFLPLPHLSPGAINLRADEESCSIVGDLGSFHNALLGSGDYRYGNLPESHTVTAARLPRHQLKIVIPKLIPFQFFLLPLHTPGTTLWLLLGQWVTWTTALLNNRSSLHAASGSHSTAAHGGASLTHHVSLPFVF